MLKGKASWFKHFQPSTNMYVIRALILLLTIYISTSSAFPSPLVNRESRALAPSVESWCIFYPEKLVFFFKLDFPKNQSIILDAACWDSLEHTKETWWKTSNTDDRLNKLIKMFLMLLFCFLIINRWGMRWWW